MKILPIISLLLISTPVYAIAKDNSQQGQGQAGLQTHQPSVEEATLSQSEDAQTEDTQIKGPTQNQLRQTTQNQSEDTQLRITSQEIVRTQEKMQTMTPEEVDEIAKNAQQNMGEVAKQVHEILDDTNRYGGIGEKVREIAKSQNDAQDSLQQHYNKLKNQSAIVKAIFGSSPKSIEEIETIISENEARVNELIELKDQITNSGEIEELDEMISSIDDQNIGLLKQLEEEKSTGIFKGFMAKLGNLFKFGFN